MSCFAAGRTWLLVLWTACFAGPAQAKTFVQPSLELRSGDMSISGDLGIDLAGGSVTGTLRLDAMPMRMRTSTAHIQGEVRITGQYPGGLRGSASGSSELAGTWKLSDPACDAPLHGSGSWVAEVNAPDGTLMLDLVWEEVSAADCPVPVPVPLRLTLPPLRFPPVVIQPKAKAFEFSLRFEDLIDRVRAWRWRWHAAGAAGVLFVLWLLGGSAKKRPVRAKAPPPLPAAPAQTGGWLGRCFASLLALAGVCAGTYYHLLDVTREWTVWPDGPTWKVTGALLLAAVVLLNVTRYCLRRAWGKTTSD
jgi:hypothetical protein